MDQVKKGVKPKRISRGGLPVKISKRTQIKDGKEYTCWQIFWREEGRNRSNTRATEKKARALADEIAIRLAKGEMRQRILSGHELTEYEKSIELCKKAGGTILDASRLLAATQRPPQRKLLHEIRTEFLASKATRAPRHVESLRNDTKLLIDSFGERPIMELTVSDLSSWLRTMQVAGRTKRNRFTNNRTMFRWARNMGYLPDTQTEIDRIDSAIWAENAREDWQEDEGFDDFSILTPEQLGLFFEVIPLNSIPILALGAFAGIRRSEILRLHWRMIHETYIEVPRIVARKKKKSRNIPYLEACKAWLEPCRKASGLIVPHADRFTQMTDTFRKVELGDWPNNALRHSFISYRVAMIKNKAQVANEAGTSVEKINQNYDKVATEHDAKAWFSVMP